MAEGKKSFIFYSDWIDTFKQLPKDKGYDLLMHILSYVNDEDPTSDDFIINAVFAQMKNTLKRDLKKWETQRLQRVEAGKKSAEVRKAKRNERLTVVNEKERNSTVNVSDNVNVSDKEKDNNILFDLFWDSYHSITGKLKTEKDQSIKYFKRLSKKDKQKAIDNIKPYFDSLNDKKYCKKARTYLSDKNFNDEFRPQRPKITKLAGT